MNALGRMFALPDFLKALKAGEKLQDAGLLDDPRRRVVFCQNTGWQRINQHLIFPRFRQ